MTTRIPAQQRIDALKAIIRRADVPLNAKALRERLGRPMPAGWEQALKSDPDIDWKHTRLSTQYFWAGK